MYFYTLSLLLIWFCFGRNKGIILFFGRIKQGIIGKQLLISWKVELILQILGETAIMKTKRAKGSTSTSSLDTPSYDMSWLLLESQAFHSADDDENKLRVTKSRGKRKEDPRQVER